PTRRPRPTSPPFPYTTLFRSEPAVPLTLDVVSNILKEDSLSLQTDATCQHSRTTMPTPLQKRTNYLLQLSRYKLRILIGILTGQDRKSTRLNSSHVSISYAVF